MRWDERGGQVRGHMRMVGGGEQGMEVRLKRSNIRVHVDKEKNGV